MLRLRHLLTYAILLLFIAVVSGCSVVGGIFKAGIWVGVLAVVGIIALIGFLVSRGSGKK